MRSTRPWSGAHGVALVLAILVAACSATSDAPASVWRQLQRGPRPPQRVPVGDGRRRPESSASASSRPSAIRSRRRRASRSSPSRPSTTTAGSDDGRDRGVRRRRRMDLLRAVRPPNCPAFSSRSTTRRSRATNRPGAGRARRRGDILALVPRHRRTRSGQPADVVGRFFDVASYPGKRGLYDGYYAFMWALLADGVPIDQLIPLHLEPAKRKLDSIRDDQVFRQTGIRCSTCGPPAKTPWRT